jgi:hypothetical protein
MPGATGGARVGAIRNTDLAMAVVPGASRERRSGDSTLGNDNASHRSLARTGQFFAVRCAARSVRLKTSSGARVQEQVYERV